MPTTCQILKPTEQNLDHCAELLRNGQVVGVPTETVYGLAGNPLNEISARRIFSVKGRPLIDPLIVHFPTPEAATQYIEKPDGFDQLAEHFWPGPMTLVVKKASSIPDIITAGLDSVAIRVPQHPIFHSLLKRLDFPLAAPSANPFGYVSPTQATHVQTTLGERIPAILNGGDSQHGLESTIIDLRDPKTPTILRHGPVLQKDVSKVLGKEVFDGTHSKTDSAQAAPGMLTQHYSPNTAVQLLDNDRALQQAFQQPPAATAAIFQRKPELVNAHTFWLSENGNLNEIAHNMFALIQQLDQLNYEQLYIAKAPDTGIGKAINDRLSRAAAKLKQ